MKNLLFVAVFTMIFATVSSVADDFVSRDSVIVGSQPACIIDYNGPWSFDVICLGKDVNFDNVYDSATDELPSWWRVSVPMVTYRTFKPWSSQEKLRDFEFGSPGFPLRPLLHNDNLYLHQNSFIKKFRMSDASIVDSIPFEQTVAGLSSEDGVIFVSVRNIPAGAWVADTNYIVALDMTTNLPMDTIPAGKNIQMTKSVRIDNQLYLLVLNEGFGGEDDSFVSMYSYPSDATSTFELVRRFNAGKNGNFFQVIDQKKTILIVSNGSHKVFEYALDSDEIVREYNLPTSLYDGPRELSYSENDNKFYVSTYAGKVYEFDYGTSESLKSFDAHSKTEAVYAKYNSNYVAATCISNSDYSANNIVSIWLLGNGDVRESKTNMAVYPNPAIDKINVKFDSYEEFFTGWEIYSLSGEIVAKGLILADNFDINVRSLQSGSYMIRIQNGNYYKTSMFSVVK